MRVSQLIHAMDRDDLIIINDGNKKINCMEVYNGEVRGIKKDDPINRYHVHHIFADGDTIVVLAEEQREEKEKAQKIYFTPEEVRKMSRKEVRDNYAAIINSMKKWK